MFFYTDFSASWRDEDRKKQSFWNLIFFEKGKNFYRADFWNRANEFLTYLIKGYMAQVIIYR